MIMDRFFVSHIALFCLLAGSSAQTFKDIEYPCHPKWHTPLKQHYRSTGFDTRSGDTPMCDNYLKKGWYRFLDVEGTTTEIATECPGTNTCGTVTPVWMNGSHPQVNDGIVVRRVCGQMYNNNTDNSCCDYQDDLFVKNCSGFYIYYLSPTFNCPSGYCAGTSRRCPVGQWSNTDMEPCRDLAPVLATPPVVKGPTVHPNQTFSFQCQIQFGPNDPDQVFQVLWTFNNKSDPAIKPDILTGPQKVATLSGDRLKGHLDSDIGCQVSTYYIPEKNKNTYSSQTNYFGVESVNLTGPHLRGNTSFDFECHVTTDSNDKNQHIEVIWTFDGQQDPIIKSQVLNGGARKASLDGGAIRGHVNSNVGCEARLTFEGYTMKTEFRKSNTYFAGIQVSPGRLEINESEGETGLTVTSTIPVVCDQGQGCCLTFMIKVDNNTVVTLKESCNFSMCLSDWDSGHKKASFNVTVVPSRNAISAGTRNAVLSFQDVVISGAGRYTDIFKTYRPKPVQIVVRLQAGFKCSITGDPHFQGFDFKRAFDLYQTGDYTVYAVRNRDFLVQIRSWPCWAVTCVCGVAVRERNDIIRIHGCDKPGKLMSATVDVPHTLSPGTVVKRSSNGQHVGILLSSGSEIKIDMYNMYMDAYIQTPAYDKNKASGICGTNDGNPDNDFTHPDGTVTPVCKGQGRCIPVTFTESWRVTEAESLFVTSPKQVLEKPPQQYCSCSVSSGHKPTASCSPRQHIQDSNISCKNCREITRYLKPSPWGQPGQKEPPYKHKEVKFVDPNKQWPNDQGITESQAKEMCSKAIEKSQLYNQCKDTSSLLDSALADCLGDILDGGTQDTLQTVTSSFTSKCQMDLANDEKNYQQRSEGHMTLNKEFSAHICPVECSDHGKCTQNGTCECQDGWQGDTCQIETGKGPQITWASGSPWCDVNQMSCQHFQFDKSNVNIHDKLKCRVQPVDNQGNKSGQPSVLYAAGDSSTRVACPLPKTNFSSQNYTVSVSSDGKVYGNELPVYTFDSVCLSCNASGCQMKDTGCHINNMCRRDGETNRHNGQLVCDVSRNLTHWSHVTEVARTSYKTVTSFPDQTTLAHTSNQTTSGSDNNLYGSRSSTSLPASVSRQSTSAGNTFTSAAQRQEPLARNSYKTTNVSFLGQTTLASNSLSHSQTGKPYQSTFPTSSSKLTSDRSVSSAASVSDMYRTTVTTTSQQANFTGGLNDVTISRLATPTIPASDSGNTTLLSNQRVPSTSSNHTTAPSVVEITTNNNQKILRVLEQFVEQMKSWIERLRKQ